MQKLNDRLYSWASDIEVDTILQAEKAARLPVVHDHVALMPDAHVGIGATVGSVIPTKEAIIPSAVGVDIGCGMIAAQLNLSAADLPTNLDNLKSLIAQAIPAGKGQGHEGSSSAAEVWMGAHRPATHLTSKQVATTLSQFGSLGGGNHFFEVCLDEGDQVWVVLHSGSRGIGNQLARDHIAKAKVLARHEQVALEDPDLAWFIQGTPEFDAYISDMRWAQDYARANRDQMMEAALLALGAFTGPFRVVDRINCHHNFTEQEEFDGVSLWITRKGAIKADVGDRGVIPGSMGTRSYIVSGRGVRSSWNSCSHGAGRRMSRSEAKRKFTVEDLVEQMAGKTWQPEMAASLVDEIPSSYKDIDQVMDDQADLVQVDAVLHQIFNFKGA